MSKAIFRASITSSDQLVVVERDGMPGKPGFRITMTPAEADKASQLVGIALSISEMDAIPDHIANTPFVIRFFPHSGCALERSDIAGSLPFRLREGDELIKIIQAGVAMSVNARQLRGPARPGPVGNFMASNEVV